MSNDPYFVDPAIIIIVPEDSPVCKWVSVGWRTIKNCRTPQSKELMGKAERAIHAADTILEAKANLEAVGFTVTIDPDYQKGMNSAHN
jgi:hypothetical protein